MIRIIAAFLLWASLATAAMAQVVLVKPVPRGAILHNTPTRQRSPQAPPPPRSPASAANGPTSADSSSTGGTTAATLGDITVTGTFPER